MPEYRPSSAPYAALCVGRVQFTDGMPDTAGAAAQRGTAIHALAAGCLVTDTDPNDYVGVEFEGVIMDDECVRIADRYVGRCRDLAMGGSMLVEQKFDVSRWTQNGREGTADLVVLQLENKQVIVSDLKSGRTKVMATEQIEIYLLAVRAWLQKGGMDTSELSFQGIIDQPPIDHIDQVVFTDVEMTDLDKKHIALKAAIWAENPPLTAGEMQCRYCLGKAVCPAYAESVSSVVKFEAPGFDASAPKMTGTRIGSILPHLEAIRRWCDAVQGEAVRLLEVGATVPGYKMVVGKQGNRAYDDPVEVEEMVRRMRAPLRETHTFRLKTPAQLSKVLGPKQWKKIEARIVRKAGAHAVVPQDDPRPAIEVPTFEEITDE